MRNFRVTEYLAVLIAAGALIVSVYSPFRDYFAAPDLKIILPSQMQFGTNIGITQATPMITIINDGSAPGHFAEIRCFLSNDVGIIELRAMTITVPIGNPMPFAGTSLASSEEYLNQVNCISVDGFESKSRQYDDIMADVRSEIQQSGGLNCEDNWFSRKFQFSQPLAARLVDFMDSAFSITEGDYLFKVELLDTDGAIIASTQKVFELTTDDIERFLEPRDLLAFGFGTACPLLNLGSIPVSLSHE